MAPRVGSVESRCRRLEFSSACYCRQELEADGSRVDARRFWYPATSSFDLNGNTWKPTVAGLNSAATVWKSSQVDRSDIDSDSDIIAPQPEKTFLDLGADDGTSNAVGSIFSPKARDGRLDSIMQTASPKQEQHQATKPLIDTSAAQANGGGGPSHDNHAYDDAKSPTLQQPEPETNLMDNDWGNPPDGAGMTFAETAEPLSFDDDDDDDGGRSNIKAPAKQQQSAAATARQQQNYGGQMNNGSSHSGLVWPSELEKQRKQKNEYDHLLWVRTVD